jgi:predicted nucleic acid-binding protein
VSELVVDARVLVYRVIVGISNTAELPTLDARLRGASALLAPSCEFLRSHRILKSLARDGDITPSEAMRMSMLVCESGVELRPLWPWDIPRISTLNCHPSDAWCIAVAESVGVTFVTRNAALQSLDTACPIEVY